MMYRVQVKESHRRIVYVDAEDAQNARVMARDPSNWWDAEDPDTAVEVRVYSNSVSRVESATTREP